MDKRYSDIYSLLSACLVHDEYSDTAPLIASLSHVRETSYFTRSEFLTMCKWKELRERRQNWARNKEDEVRFTGYGIPENDAQGLIVGYGFHLSRLAQLLVGFFEYFHDNTSSRSYTLYRFHLASTVLYFGAQTFQDFVWLISTENCPVLLPIQPESKVNKFTHCVMNSVKHTRLICLGFKSSLAFQ
jgi:hypothetical protein